VSDVEVAIRLRRKSGGNSAVVLVRAEVFLNDLLDEVQGLFGFGHDVLFFATDSTDDH
jgi:hypothetical protein